jgi:hypothetical protein
MKGYLQLAGKKTNYFTYFLIVCFYITVSLMDSISAEYEKELLEDSDKLLDYLGDRVDQINQILTDDETFCDIDINATIKYIETIEDKFHKKAQELKNKLKEMRTENVRTSENNKKQFDEELEKINDLFSKGKHHEGLLECLTFFSLLKFFFFSLE